MLAFAAGLGWVIVKTGEGAALAPTMFLFEAADYGAMTYAAVAAKLAPKD